MFKFIASAAITATFVTVPLAAQAEDTLPEVVISYADLNLGSKAGQDILDRRISQAVDKVCGGPALKTNLSFARPVRECIEQVSRNASKAKALAMASYTEERLAARDRKIRLAVR